MFFQLLSEFSRPCATKKRAAAEIVGSPGMHRRKIASFRNFAAENAETREHHRWAIRNQPGSRKKTRRAGSLPSYHHGRVDLEVSVSFSDLMRSLKLHFWSPSCSTAWIVVSTLLLAGCRYDGSFMQMNSDAGAPFFGLQLSVRNDRSPQPSSPGVIQDSSSSAAETAIVSDRPEGITDDPAANDVALVVIDPAETAPGRFASGLVPTSARSEFRSRVRRTLDAGDTSPWISADEVQLRINEF